MTPQHARHRQGKNNRPPVAMSVAAAEPPACVAAVNLDAPPTAIGVGIDTSRYGHHATFLRADLQPAAEGLDFAESAAG